MEVLATEPGMKPIDEPFRASKLRRAGIPVHSPSARRRPSRASPTFLPNMRSSTAHTSETSAGCGIAPWSPTSEFFRLVTDRRVLKVIWAPAIAEWLETEDFGFQIVYLLPHPIATAVSRKRGVSTSGGWAKARSKRAKPFPIKAAAYLVDEGFVRAHLMQPQVDIGWEVLRHGSLLERHVLDWRLENMVPLHVLRDRHPDWLVLTYEELVLSPRRTIGLARRASRSATPRALA